MTGCLAVFSPLVHRGVHHAKSNTKLTLDYVQGIRFCALKTEQRADNRGRLQQLWDLRYLQLVCRSQQAKRGKQPLRQVGSVSEECFSGGRAGNPTCRLAREGGPIPAHETKGLLLQTEPTHSLDRSGTIT